LGREVQYGEVINDEGNTPTEYRGVEVYGEEIGNCGSKPC